MGWGVTSVVRRSTRTIRDRYESGVAAVRIEDRVVDTRGEAGFGVQARPILPRSGATTGLGAILAQPAGMAAAE